jgi:hypothetical protein
MSSSSINRNAKRQELVSALLSSSSFRDPYTLANILIVPPVSAHRASSQEPYILQGNNNNNNNNNNKIQDANGTDWTRVANLWLDACEFAAAVSV